MLALIGLMQCGSTLANQGVDFDATSFEDLGTAMGGADDRVRSGSELDLVLAAAIAARSFLTIAREIGERSYDGRI